jgi:uncharacterized protein
MEVASWTWRVKLSMSLSLDLMREMRERAEEEAIHVFARNLKDLLLAAPAGSRATMGLDPGIRTGVKVAVVDAHRQAHRDLHRLSVPAEQRRARHAGRTCLADPQAQCRADLDRQRHRQPRDRKAGGRHAGRAAGPKPTKVIVSEAGASVYSASAAAAAEFPGLDVSLRGAVSIARRLQDPLAELVKIEPKSIGVGQYQHDVDQTACRARSMPSSKTR